MNTKYRGKGYKPYKFGDFLANSGKFVLNNLDAVQSGLTGQDYYDPDFQGKKAKDWDKVADINSKYLSTASGMAANYFVPGSTAAISGMAGAVNPQGTPANNSPELAQLGNLAMSTMKYGGKMCYKPMNGGGNLTHIPESSGTHEQNPNGGVDLDGFKASVEGGETINPNQEYVYSNSLLIDSEMVSEFGLPKYLKGKSFATASKALEKKFPRADRFDRMGKEKMLGRLTEAQEALKENMDNELMNNFQTEYQSRIKKMGGKLYKKYVTGGGLGNPPSFSEWLVYNPEGTPDEYAVYKRNLTKPNPGFTQSDSLGSRPSSGVSVNLGELKQGNTGLGSSTYKPGNANNYPDGFWTENVMGEDPTLTIPPDVYGNTPGSINNSLPFNTDYGLKSSSNTQSPTDFMTPSFKERAKEFISANKPTKQDLITAGQLAPIAFNTVEGIRRPDRLNPNDYQTKGRYKPYYYDPTEELRAVKDSFSGALEATRGATGGNAGTYLSNLSSLQGGRAKANAEIYNKKYNLDNQANATAQAGNIGIEGNNNQSRFLVDDWNMKSLQAKRNAMSKATYDLAEYSDGKNQEEYWEKMARIYGPDFYKNLREKQVGAETEDKKKYGGKLKKRFKK